MVGNFYRVALAWALSASAACASTVSVVGTDAHGRPAPDAVVALAATDKTQVPTEVPEKNIIAQRDETFVPLVVVVRKGGAVVFTNDDTTKHQVYSFSPIKQFAFEIDQGQVSAPVVFPQTGVAAIGCNIHDQMIAYVFVADSPFAAIADAKGVAEFKNVPPGAYRATFWHPRLAPGHAWPALDLKVDSAATQASLSMPLLPPVGMKNMHMDY